MDATLTALLKPEFSLSIGVGLPANVIRRNLLRSEIVKTLRGAIRGGVVTEEEIAEFVTFCEAGFEKGKRFPHEPALAAIAVALENRKTDFVSCFYIDLCRLRNLREFEFAPEVAVLSSQVWTKLPSTKTLKIAYIPTTPRFANAMKESVRVVSSEATLIARLLYMKLESVHATT